MEFHLVLNQSEKCNYNQKFGLIQQYAERNYAHMHFERIVIVLTDFLLIKKPKTELSLFHFRSY